MRIRMSKKLTPKSVSFLVILTLFVFFANPLISSVVAQAGSLECEADWKPGSICQKNENKCAKKCRSKGLAYDFSSGKDCSTQWIGVEEGCCLCQNDPALLDCETWNTGAKCKKNKIACKTFCRKQGKMVEDSQAMNCHNFWKAENCCLCGSSSGTEDCETWIVGSECAKNSIEAKKACKRQNKAIDEISSMNCKDWWKSSKCYTCKDNPNVEDCATWDPQANCAKNDGQAKKRCAITNEIVKATNVMNCYAKWPNSLCYTCEADPQIEDCESWEPGSKCAKNKKGCKRYCKAIGKTVKNFVKRSCDTKWPKELCCSCE